VEGSTLSSTAVRHLVRLISAATLAFAALTGGCGEDKTLFNADVASQPDVADATENRDAPADTEPQDAANDGTGTADAPDVPDAELADTTPTDTFDPGPDPCDEVNSLPPQFAAQVANYTAQDDLAAWPAGSVVFAGSSSIRRWEGLAEAYTDYAPIQRGMGGAALGEIAHYAEALITRHDPRAVVIYAGTNDLTGGVPAELVVERFRCLRYRIGQDLGWDRPLVFIGVTPSPARWDSWATASAFNDAVAAIAEGDPAVTFVDVAPAFLATGEPPAESLFVSDRLHLSPSGYALWDRVIRTAITLVVAPNAPASAPSPALTAGTRILVDLGPDNAEDGQQTASPDPRGQHWNNWHALEGGVSILPGERLAALVTTTGAPTGIDLVIAGGFIGNGRANGGLLAPEVGRLGPLAVGSATGDYFYVAGDDSPGALSLRGLDPARTYTLRVFAARDASEVRISRYTVSGASQATTTLQTSGAGAGSGGSMTNNDDVAALNGLRPDPWGNLFIDVTREQGIYAYVGILELTVD